MKKQLILSFTACLILLIATGAIATAQSRPPAIVAPKGWVPPVKGTTQQDLLLRMPTLAWPEAFKPEKADLFAHNELFIKVTPDSVMAWLLKTEQWQFPGLEVKTVIKEVLPGKRLARQSDSKDVSLYQIWVLNTTSDGYCFLTTEVSAHGKWAAEKQKADPGILHKANDKWLEALQRKY